MASLMRAIASSRGSTPDKREEARLHDRVDARAHAVAARHVERVDHVEAQPLLEDAGLHVGVQPIPDRVGTVRAVDEQHRAGGGGVEHVVAIEEAELVAADEAGLPDQIRRPDRRRAETQVRDRDRARLLRVVDEVALGVARRVARR